MLSGFKTSHKATTTKAMFITIRLYRSWTRITSPQIDSYIYIYSQLTFFKKVTI